MKITGMVWKTGNGFVITLPKNQIKVNRGDRLLIDVTILERKETDSKQEKLDMKK